jgi:hypothetical protein
MKTLIVGDKATVERLAERLKLATSHSQYQCIQCVLICATSAPHAAAGGRLAGAVRRACPGGRDALGGCADAKRSGARLSKAAARG